MSKIRFKGVVEYTTEDSGQALIASVGDDLDDGMFVRIQSWDEAKLHLKAKEFEGREVEIIIQTVDDHKEEET